MPITSLPYWFAKCDNCGERAEYDDFSAFEDAGQAADGAIGAEWTRKGEVWHCPACPPLDDEADVDPDSGAWAAPGRPETQDIL